MCGRYTNTAGPEELNERFGGLFRGTEGTRRYNVAPTEQVGGDRCSNGEPEARMLRWGLIPPWSKDPKIAYKMINVRIETVMSKPAFSGLIAKGWDEALQIADGYYEWLKPEKPGEPRQPFFFQVNGGIPFAFASLWTPACPGSTMSGFTA